MRNNVIGFVGIDNYEVILYLARILDNLGKKVLLVDYTTCGELEICIPIPEGLYSDTDIIKYYGLNYTRQPLDQELVKDYDDILIDFGFNYIKSALEMCTEIVYAVDQQKHNINLLTCFPDDKIQADIPRRLIIKDFVGGKIDQKYILTKIHKSVAGDVYVFDQDSIDRKKKLLVQYNTLFDFRKISAGIKSFLRQSVKNFHPDVSEKVLKDAYSKAERGH